VSRRSIERKLRQVSSRLRALREELRIADEQLAHLRDEADDMSIRAMVAETSHAGIEARHAQGHADAMAKHRTHLADSIAQLERTQDQLLDDLSAAT
jgi:hypothetical protein